MSENIHIDNNGIGWWVWGKRWRYIRWVAVKMITIATVIVRNWIPRFVTSYCFYTTEYRSWFNSQRHGMGFSNDLPNSGALIEAVDKYVRQLNIPVLDNRAETEVRQTHL